MAWIPRRPAPAERVGMFTGRLSESRALRAAADSARAGTAAVVLVQGPPGVGKTALVRRFLAGLSGFSVLESAATPSLAPSDGDCLSRLLRQAAVRVPGRSPAGEPSAPAREKPAAASGPRALREFLDMPAAAPWALFVDDAQWADGASLKVLLEAAREGGPLCLVLAARHTRGWDEEVLRALHTVAPLTHVDLAELGEAEAGTLVATALGDLADDMLTRRLVLRSGGHPLYLRSLLDGHTTARPGGPPWPALPASVVRRQLKGVPAEGVAALEALAVLGGSATVPTLSTVLGAPDCASALDPLVHEEFITRTDVHVPTVAIRHGVFRDALYDTLPAARRRALHVAAAGAVDERRGLAHKVAAAETVDIRLSADLLETAAHELTEGGLLHAARTLLSAASLSHADDHRTDHLLYGAVRLLFWAGADAELSRHGEAVAARRPCPWRDEALGLTEFAAGRLTSARRLLDQAGQSLRGAHPGQRAVVRTELALVHAILGQGEATRLHADQALREAAPEGEACPYGGPAGRHRGTDPATDRPAPDEAADAGPPSGGLLEVCAQGPCVVVPPGVRQAARALAAYGTALRDGPRAGLDLLAGLPEDADRIGEEDLPALTVRGILRLADAQLSSGTTDLTMVTARRRPGAARLLGTSASVHLAMCHLLGGDWNRAVREVETALDDEQGRCFDPPALWSLRSVLDAFRGDTGAAEAGLRRARGLAQPLDFGGPQYHTAMARAMGARARGDHRGVVDALQILAERSAHSERVRIVSTSWLPFFAESLVECGLADLARAAVAELTATGAAANPHLRVADAWLRGRTAEAAGAHEAALGRYAEAVGLLGPGRDIPLVRGLLEISRGRVSAALGAAGAARAYFDSAEDVFTRLGARPFLEECRAERRARVPERPDTSALDRLLTGREREVARLVGLGCTNREIADELTLSVKTIEYHLRGVFVKLGLRSRGELRRRVQEAGGADGRR
ncbi:LuxR family transcriptional regulator [Streptomyces sp. PsTaAH-130]|uniref:AAA family ATPase n=3 Tax=Streptomyces TaxID=1883 RepID=UPI000DBA690A|nr:LuxR family transcriptional regulator [Streptomyces sp. PsTaAH-130]RAJ61594.1 regulatory LuxR family protein [Streptomyces sp. PsTaAH-130]